MNLVHIDELIKNMPFEFQIIIDDLEHTRYGNGAYTPEGECVHHSAVTIQVANYNGVARIKSFARSHLPLNGGIAYRLGVTADNNKVIYVLGYLDTWTHHLSNGVLNRLMSALLVDGNFDIDNPTDLMLCKIRFVLDWLDQGGFGKHPDWQNHVLDRLIGRMTNPDHKLSGNARTVSALAWHDEAAERPRAENGWVNNATACCGRNLKPYIEDYRNKRGNVDWGDYRKYMKQPEKPQEPQQPQQPQLPFTYGDEPAKKMYSLQDVQIFNINSMNAIGTLKAEKVYDVLGKAVRDGKTYFITEYSYKSKDPLKFNGVEERYLVTQEQMDEINRLRGEVSSANTQRDEAVRAKNEAEQKVTSYQARIDSGELINKVVYDEFVASTQKKLDEQVGEVRKEFAEEQKAHQNTKLQLAEVRTSLNAKTTQLDSVKAELQALKDGGVYADTAISRFMYWLKVKVNPYVAKLSPYVLTTTIALLTYITGNAELTQALGGAGLGLLALLQFLKGLDMIADKEREKVLEGDLPAIEETK